MRNLRTEEHLVRRVPQPEFTKSWHPISHNSLLDAMYDTLDVLDTRILDTDYTLSEDGMNLFGTWTLDTEYKGNNLNVGFRNSMKKQFAVGFCAGRFIIVCSNLQFSGEFVEFRKHTSGLDMDEVLRLSRKGFHSIKSKMVEFTDWHESLNNVPLEGNDFKQLTYDAMLAGVFPPSKFKSFLECYGKERTLYGQNLFSFYGGVTRLVKDTSLFNIQQTTHSLNTFSKSYQQLVA